MNTPSKFMRKAVLSALVPVGTGALVTLGSVDAKAQPGMLDWIKAPFDGAPAPTAVVPNVIDEPLNMAEQDIRAVGLVPKWSGGSDAPVVFQAPKPGSSVPVGSTVTIVLNDHGDN